MTIIREFNGQTYKIELTKDELSIAYEEKKAAIDSGEGKVYWVAYETKGNGRKDYFSKIDADGCQVISSDKSKAARFPDVKSASSLIKYGFQIMEIAV